MYPKICQNVGTIFIHFAYILLTSFVYILYDFCLQNVYIISLWEATFSHKVNKPLHLPLVFNNSNVIQIGC